MPSRVRATKIAGPAARGGWRQLELRVGRVNTRAAFQRLLSPERMPDGPGPWFILFEMRVEDDGRVSNTVARDYRSDDLLWYSSEKDAAWHANLFADAFAAQEPRNPHPVRVLDLQGRCIHAARGSSSPSGQGFREVACADAPPIAVRRARERARATVGTSKIERALAALRTWRSVWSRARGPIAAGLERPSRGRPIGPLGDSVASGFGALEPSDWDALGALARAAGVFDAFQLLSRGESHDKRLADDVVNAMRSTAWQETEAARATRSRAPRVTPRVPVEPERWWKEGALPGGRGATGWPMFDFKIAPRRVYGGTEQWAVFRARTWEDGPPTIDRMTDWMPNEHRAWIEAEDMAQGVSQAEARVNPRNPHPVRLLDARGACVMAFRAGFRVPCP